jgi:acetyl esterase/lipase
MRLRLAIFAIFAAASASAQTADRADQIAYAHQVSANVVYNVASGQELKLDVYRPLKAAAPVPVAMFIHGGGWVAGTKEGSILYALPFLEMGMAVVNMEYRLAKVAPAPAAVEDCRCALRWIVRNAERFKFDTTRIVVGGGSAGGHLALMTGMVTASAGFDRGCPTDDKIRWTGSDKSEPKVAAIINWFGITDVNDMLEDGGNARGYAIEWVGDRNDVARIATRVSPLTYVRAALPPILTIHGDNDTLVPVSHARRLHEALQKAGAPNQLLILPGAGHGDFNAEQVRQSSDAVRAFLRTHGILK